MFTFRPVLAALFLSVATGCAAEAAEEVAQNDESSEKAEAKKIDEEKKEEGVKVETDNVQPAKKNFVDRKSSGN